MAVFMDTMPIGGYVKSFQYPFNVGFGGGGPRSDSSANSLDNSALGGKNHERERYILPLPTRARRVSGSKNRMTSQRVKPEMARKPKIQRQEV